MYKYISHCYYIFLILGTLSLVCAHESCCPSQEYKEPDSHAHHSHKVDHLQLFFRDCFERLKETCPFIMVGMLSVAIFQAIPTPVSFIQRHISIKGEASTLSSFFLCIKASFLGLCVPLCSCAALPIAISLRKAGSSPASITSFMTAAQSAGLDSFIITLGILGYRSAITRLMSAFILAIVGGFAVGKTTTEIKSFQSPSARKNSSSSCCISEDTVSNKDIGVFGKIMRINRYVLDIWDEIIPFVIFGLIFSVFCLHYVQIPAVMMYNKFLVAIGVPKSTAYGGTPASLTELIIACLTRTLVFASVLPLQLCEHATVTFSAALVKAGASQGVAFAFLILAPATNLSTLGLIVKDGWLRVFWVGIAFVFTSLIISFIIDYTGVDMAVESKIPELVALNLSWDIFCKSSVYMSLILVVLSMIRRMAKNFIVSKKHVD